MSSNGWESGAAAIGFAADQCHRLIPDDLVPARSDCDVPGTEWAEDEEEEVASLAVMVVVV